MRYSFFPLKTVVIAFLLAGPFIWPLAFGLVSVASGDQTIDTNPFTLLLGQLYASLMGGLLWWAFSLAGNFSLSTIVPTTLAAIAYWYLITFVCSQTQITFYSKTVWVIFNVIVCAIISATIFYLVVSLANLPTSISHKGPLSFWVFVVFTVGAVLGLILGIWSSKLAPNPSFKRDAALTRTAP